MTNHQSIFKVLTLGHIVINLPIFVISIGLPLLCFSVLGELDIFIKLLSTMICFAIGLVIGWIWWSLIIAKWRVWAFEQVEEDAWIALERKAISGKLIWENGSIFEKTEIRNAAESLKISQIKERLGELHEIDKIKWDLATPAELGYKISKSNLIVMMLMRLLVFAAAVFLFLRGSYWWSLPLLLIVLYKFKIKKIGYLWTEEDELILTEEGIYIGYIYNVFFRWNEMDWVYVDRGAKEITICLNQEAKKEVGIPLDDFKINDFYAFEKRIYVFVERFNLKHELI